MQIANQVNKEGKEELIIFGDDEFVYKLNITSKIFIKSGIGIGKPIISVISKNNKIYGLTDGNEISVASFDGDNWACTKLS
jgi:hypothetical protein